VSEISSAMKDDEKSDSNIDDIVKPLIVALFDGYRSLSDILHSSMHPRHLPLIDPANLIITTIHRLQLLGSSASNWRLDLLCIGAELAKFCADGRKSRARRPAASQVSPVHLSRDIASITAIMDAFKIARHGRGKEYDAGKSPIAHSLAISVLTFCRDARVARWLGKLVYKDY
jgi:hypothetical protein